VDGTFKVVREPFRQLFSVHAFVKRDGQLKQVSLAFVLMTSRRRVDYVRVLQALLDALPQPPAVQTVVSDFEAALWSAVRDVFHGVAQLGCEFQISQAVWRNVQSVGLQSAYAKDDVTDRICRKTQALCFLPADVIGDEFGKLEQVGAAGGDTRVQEHLQYRTSAVPGLTAVGDRQRGRYFASRSAPTTMLKAGITV